MRLARLAAACLAATLTFSAPLAAQDEVAAAAPSRCTAPEYRQFDFWLGEWEVTSNETPAGTNSIVATQGGCVLQENWQGAGPGGITGSSFNIYDRERQAWHQTWVDASGTLLLLDGGVVDDKDQVPELQCGWQSDRRRTLRGRHRPLRVGIHRLWRDLDRSLAAAHQRLKREHKPCLLHRRNERDRGGHIRRRRVHFGL